VATSPIPLVDQKDTFAPVSFFAFDTHAVLQCALKKGTEYLAREALKAPKRSLLIDQLINCNAFYRGATI